MIIDDVGYLLGQFFAFYLPLFGICAFIYATVLMFRKVLKL